jgi:quercetin dioxygenase-like cupin family protein
MRTKPCVVPPDERPDDGWNDPMRGKVAWRTHLSGERTATAEIVCGIAYFERGDVLKRHRHPIAEVVHVLAGRGIAEIDGVEVDMMPGSTIFVPPGAMHQWRTVSDEGLRFFYVFGADKFEDVDYIFEGSEA